MQTLRAGEPAERAALIQRQLIDLIDFFDPVRIRFPDVNERGKVPAPSSFSDRKRLRPATEIARFRFTEDANAVVAAWVAQYGLKAQANDSEVRVRLPRSLRSGASHLVTTQRGTWVELHISRYASQRGKDEYGQRHPRLSRGQAILINHLLDRFGRPRLLIRSRRLVRS